MTSVICGNGNEEEADMAWENVKRKLTSRKFWLALVSFVTMVAIACGLAEEAAAQVGSIIMAGATVIAYILGEGMTDAAAAGDGKVQKEEKT